MAMSIHKIPSSIESLIKEMGVARLDYIPKLSTYMLTRPRVIFDVHYNFQADFGKWYEL